MAINGGAESINSFITSLNTGIEKETAITENIIDNIGSNTFILGNKIIIMEAMMTPIDYIISPKTCIQAAFIL